MDDIRFLNQPRIFQSFIFRTIPVYLFITMPESCECTSEEERCSTEKCDIFDFMARHVGMTVIHPGGFKATRMLLHALRLEQNNRVLDIACGKGTSALLLAKRYGCSVVGIDLAGDLVEEARDAARRRGLAGRNRDGGCGSP